MRRVWVAALALLLAGCGVRPSGVTAMREAPTGVAAGVTLYFVDGDRRLVPQLRETDRLGTITAALAMLLDSDDGDGDGDGDGLHTEIEASGVTTVLVNTEPGLIHLRLPLADYEVTPLGIDQIVCTALGVAVQSGSPVTTRVRLSFTLPSPESEPDRTCPLIG